MMISSLRNNIRSTITCLVIVQFLLSSLHGQIVEATQQYPPNFFNHSGCLYVTTTDTSQYRVYSPTNGDTHTGPLGKLTYDSKSVCIVGDQPGLLMMNFETNDNYFQSMSIELQIKNDTRNFNWYISSAILNIVPINSQLFPEKQLVLNTQNGNAIYAPLDRSYSCSSLVFTNSAGSGPSIKITLRRFQMQPFHEPDSRIFAISRDCSSWLTLPQIMGFILVLFMIFTVLIGAYLLLDLGGHSGDIRFSKQGGMLMNQAQLDATKAD